MRSLSIGITIRITFLVLWAFVAAWSWQQNNTSLVLIMTGLIIFSAVNLYYFTTTLNKKLSRIFDSIQYEDFAITFRADNTKGDSFEELNASLNAVIKSFNQVRAEREATLHFIQAIIQQINVGVISYNTEGKIELINQAANKILSIYKLSHISTVKEQQPEIYELMSSLPSGESKLLKLKNQEISLSVKEIILRDRKIRLIVLHNIRSELQTRELEAWQNLTKVLRHEIMNTVTPIVSLSETMRDIIEVDLNNITGHQQEEGVKDLKNAITTVINRSKGIMNFVNAYREFTNIPLPNVIDFQISQVFDDLKSLYEHENIEFIIEKNFKLVADPDQIEQVLINLIKNAIEATFKEENAQITVRAFVDHQNKNIEVIDNGIGVSGETLDNIFVPFFTTKPTGTGIGLSLSRQIIQMHGGILEYEGMKPKGSKLFIVFC